MNASNTPEMNAVAAPPSPQEVAERCADLMWAEDLAVQSLGIERVAIAPGEAVMRMKVRADMTNGHGICHGGFIFTLADSAFAYACNSFNVRTVASGVDINFIAPAHRGEVLLARGHARHQGGRSGVYDIEVETEAGKLIAVFRGRSGRIKGQFFTPDGPAAD